jgi:hypothetical protein
VPLVRELDGADLGGESDDGEGPGLLAATLRARQNERQEADTADGEDENGFHGDSGWHFVIDSGF